MIFLHRDFFLWEIIAPLGISSFIIFQCISYLMDLYQGKAQTCRNFLDFALYISFFPKLSQGPIVKYKDMEAQLKYRTITFDKFLRGLERFIMGLSKKVLIADILGQTSSSIFYNMGMGMDAGTALDCPYQLFFQPLYGLLRILRYGHRHGCYDGI